MEDMKLLSMAVLLAVVTIGCARRPVPATLLPQTSEAAGWVKTGSTRVFEAQDLWRYIDGDAERYVRAGVRRTVTAEYRYQDRMDAVADVHVISTSDGAKKLFESESSAGSRSIDVGDAARMYGQMLVFTKGAYLVRLVAYQDAPDVPEKIIALARAIERRLPAA